MFAFPSLQMLLPLYVARLLKADTRGSSDKPRENCQGCLGIVSFLSFPTAPPKEKEGKKEQRFWLFASLLGDSQTDLL